MINNTTSSGRNIISASVIFDNEYNIISGDENFYRFVSPMIKKIVDAIHQIEIDDFFAVVSELSTYSTSTMVLRIRRFDNSFRWVIATIKQLNVKTANEKAYYEMKLSDIINLHNHYTALTSVFNPKKVRLLLQNTKSMDDMIHDAKSHHENNPQDQIHFGIVQIDNLDTIAAKYGSETVEKLKNDTITQIYESLGDSRFISHTEDGRIGFYAIDMGVEINVRSFMESFRNQIQWQYLAEDANEKIDVQFTIGISEYPRNGNNIDIVIEKMNRAFNIADSKGGNRYIIYKEEIHGE